MEAKKYKYDAFLSHNHQDKPAVEQIARWLEDEAKLKVWLDKWNLVPGDPWQEELEKALDQSRCCVIFLGPGGLGSWQNEEMRAALDDRVSRKTLRVLPVLLPNARRPEKESNIPKFLRRLTWVAFKNDIDEPDGLKQLVCGIKGVPPGRADTIIATEVCPFRGLEVFREQDAPFFFGRECEVQQLLDYMGSHRFIAVIGPSGSGKSSVIQAGLIPALKNLYCIDENNKVNSNLKTALFTPKERPLEELAFVLRRLMQETETKTHTEEILTRLQKSEKSESLHYIAREICEATGAQQILLVIDQFEEIFTQTGNEREREKFIANIIDASEKAGGPVWSILTMRSDFLGKCAAYAELNTFIVDNLFQIGPMDEKNLARAIEDPARLAGLLFEEGLISDILKDASGAPGELPLVEHALLELYNKREGSKLTQKAYTEIGRIEGALTKRADTEYEKLTPQQKEIIQKIFVLRLVQPGEGTADTRRRATMEELLATGENADVTAAVLKQWTDARLLTTMTDQLKKKQMVDVAHEALIRKWHRLQEWLAQKRETARLIDQLHRATDEWLRTDKNIDYLYHGAQLKQIEELYKSHIVSFTSQEIDFIQESINKRLREAQSREEFRRRSKKQLSIIIIFSFLVLAIVSLIAAKFWIDVKNIRLSPVLMAYFSKAEEQYKSGKKLEAFHLLSLAMQDANTDLREYFFSKIEETYKKILIKTYYHNSAVFGGVFSQDHRQILTFGQDTCARLWWIDSDQEEKKLQHKRFVWGAVFSDSGEKILTFSADATARLWNLKGDSIGKTMEHKKRIVGAIFSPSQSNILTWSDDGDVILWDSTGKKIQTISTHKGPVSRACFSQDGTKILSWSSSDNIVHLWYSKGNFSIPRRHEKLVKGAMFSAYNEQILTWSDDDTARIWDSNKDEPIIKLANWKNVLEADVYDSGKRILTRDKSNTLKLWDIKTCSKIDELEHEGFVKGFVLSKNREEVLTWSDDLKVRLWKILGDTKPKLINSLNHEEFVFNGHEGYVKGAIFSSDGKTILTWIYTANKSSGRKNATPIAILSRVILWDKESGQPIASNIRHSGQINSLIFSKDNNKILTCSSDNTAKLWSLKNIQLNNAQSAIEAWKNSPILIENDRQNETNIFNYLGKNIDYYWDIFGDLDFPSDSYKLQLEVLTRTRFDPLTNQIKIIPKEEFKKTQLKYKEVAGKHDKTCEYPRPNVNLKFLREEKK